MEERTTILLQLRDSAVHQACMQITHLDSPGWGLLTERSQLLVQLLKQTELRPRQRRKCIPEN